MREHFNDGVEFARFLAHRFVTDKAPNSAAALTYTTLFAVVPMMTVMFSMLSLIPAFHGMGESIQTPAVAGRGLRAVRALRGISSSADCATGSVRSCQGSHGR